jgi:hypothetical protein
MTVPDDAPPRPPPRRLLRLLVVGCGAALAVVLAQKSPKDQHLRFTLGDAAPAVTGFEVAYLPEGKGEAVRETRLTFEPGTAPRVVSHDPSLADGAYLLRIQADTREGRRTLERQVTLGGGTTQVDLGAALGVAPDAGGRAPTTPRTP